MYNISSLLTLKQTLWQSHFCVVDATMFYAHHFLAFLLSYHVSHARVGLNFPIYPQQHLFRGGEEFPNYVKKYLRFPQQQRGPKRV